MDTEQISEQVVRQAFNPAKHLIPIKTQNETKDYLPVQWRLVWFREKYSDGSIETEMLHLDLDRDTEEEVYVWNNERRRSEKVIKQAKGFVVFRAVVKDGQGGVATGTKSEKAASFPDFIEKAETGAIGRALAALGYGTQFTGDEWNEHHRTVDAPVEHRLTQQELEQKKQEEETLVSPQQLSSIRKLSELLEKTVPDGIEGLNFLSARKVIKQLSAELKAAREARQQEERAETANIVEMPSNASLEELQDLAKQLHPDHTFGEVVSHYVWNKQRQYDPEKELSEAEKGILSLRLRKQAKASNSVSYKKEAQ